MIGMVELLSQQQNMARKVQTHAAVGYLRCWILIIWVWYYCVLGLGCFLEVNLATWPLSSLSKGSVHPHYKQNLAVAVGDAVAWLASPLAAESWWAAGSHSGLQDLELPNTRLCVAYCMSDNTEQLAANPSKSVCPSLEIENTNRLELVPDNVLHQMRVWYDAAVSQCLPTRIFQYLFQTCKTSFLQRSRQLDYSIPLWWMRNTCSG